jgi:hypothetical protein
MEKADAEAAKISEYLEYGGNALKGITYGANNENKASYDDFSKILSGDVSSDTELIKSLLNGETGEAKIEEMASGILSNFD